MDFFVILIIAIGLAMDAFAVSLGIGTSQQSNYPRARFRLAFHFGLFQFLMPILGWAAGIKILPFISSVDHWIAFILLAYVGINMIRSGLNKEEKSYLNDPSKGKTLVLLAIATSIDALAVGLSLAMLNIQILAPAIIIGIVTFAISMLGLFVGNLLGKKFGKQMEILGGVLLIGIGLRILISHLFGV